MSELPFENFYNLQQPRTYTESSLRQHTEIHCNTLQRAATRCNILQQQRAYTVSSLQQHIATRCNTLQHTATHCNSNALTKYRRRGNLRTHCNTLKHTVTHCNTLQQQRTYKVSSPWQLANTLPSSCPAPLRECTILEYAATHCNNTLYTNSRPHYPSCPPPLRECTTLRHTAPHCNTLKHTATTHYIPTRYHITFYLPTPAS